MKGKNQNRQKSEHGVLHETPAQYRIAKPDEFYPLQTPEDDGWADFRDQCRRQMKRPLEMRIKYGFVRPINPVGKKTKGRAFKTMAEYRHWCEQNLPDYLGFKRVHPEKEDIRE